MPDRYSAASPPPAHELEIPGSDDGGIYTERNQLGGPDEYTVNYDIWNHRGYRAVAMLVLTGPATPEAPHGPGE
jgi:hypothetical protein